MINRRFVATLILFIIAYWIFGLIFKRLETTAVETMELIDHQIFFEELREDMDPSYGRKFGLIQHGHKSTYLKFLTLLADPLSGIHKEFFHILEKTFPEPNAAMFWECIPVTMATIESTNFEFVLIRSDALSRIEPDFTPFQKKFAQSEGKSVITFANLGKDSTLVVPTCAECPTAVAPFAHLAAFMRSASFELKMEFWNLVATETLAVIAATGPNQPVWLSTSGLGVSWLHVRIDSIPKYYNWGPYKVVKESKPH